MTQQELTKIRDFFSNDRYAYISGFEITDAGDGCATCSCTVDASKHMNAAGNVMGGVYFALGDFTFAVATNYTIPLGEDVRVTVAVNNSIQYLRGVSEGVITAKAIPLKVGRSICYYRIDITDDKGRLVAHMTCTGAK